MKFLRSFARNAACLLFSSLGAFAAPVIDSIEIDPSPLVKGGDYSVTVAASDDATRGYVLLDLRPSLATVLRVELALEDESWVANGTIPAALAFEADLTAKVSVFLFDQAGQRTRTNREATVTAEPPVSTLGVTFRTPVPNTYVGSSAISASGGVTGEVASLSVNGVSANLSGSTWTASGISLVEGENTLTAVALGPNGTSATSSIQVTLDTAAPNVTITTPADRFLSANNKITVTGAINDIVSGTVNAAQARVVVNGVQAEVSNRCFLARDVPLVAGENTVTATGTDRAGNSASDSVTVTFNANPGIPLIREVSGNAQSGEAGAELAQALVVKLTDNQGSPAVGKNVIFNVTGNNGTVRGTGDPAVGVVVTTNAAGEASARWQLGTRSGAGNNVCEASAVGYAGKISFTSSASPVAPSKLSVGGGNNQTGVAGQPLPLPFVVIVTDPGHNRLAGVPVTFTVTDGGGNFGGPTTVTRQSDTDGVATAVLTLGPGAGVSNNAVEVTFPGNAGSPVSFSASAKVAGPPENTSVSGVVLDNSDLPVPGVTLSIPGTSLSTQADEQGQFKLTGAPVGHIHLHVDGTTTTRPGTWASLDFELVTVAGQDNTVGMPIYLLPLDVANGLAVSETTGGTLTIPGVPGFKLEIAPGSVTFPNGSKSGIVSATLVHNDKVPMTPSFDQQPNFIITIQPANAKFNPPAPITIPNVEGLQPREITEMYSFDHDLGQFVAIGTGTVSEDGSVVKSDPGVGILKAGWHCGGNPQATAAGITSTVSVDKVMLDLCKTGSRTVVATGNPTPPHANPFEWKKDFTGIAAADRGDVTITSSDSGNTSTGTITATKEGRVKVQVRYRCKSAQWSAWKDIDVNVLKVDFEQVAMCSGFDNTITPRALMVPKSGTNQARVIITPAPAMAGDVKFESADTAIASVSPSSASAATTITVTGVAKGSTFVLVKIDGAECGRLIIDVKERVNKTLAIHAITEENDDVQVIAVGKGKPNTTCINGPLSATLNTAAAAGDDVIVSGITRDSIHTGPDGICQTTAAAGDTQVVPVGQGEPNATCITQGTNGFRDSPQVGDDGLAFFGLGDDITTGPDGICNTTAINTNISAPGTPTAAAVQTLLNNIWGKQANVHFTVTRTDHTINYDLDRNSSLGDPLGLGAVPARPAELAAIDGSSARNGAVDYNYYITDVVDVPIAITQGDIVMSQDSSSSTFLIVVAHEVGHLLNGGGHTDGDNAYLMHSGIDGLDGCLVQRAIWNQANP